MANKPMKGKVMVRFKNVKPQEEDNSDDDVYVQSSVELSDNGLIKMLTDEIQYNIGRFCPLCMLDYDLIAFAVLFILFPIFCYLQTG